MRVACLLVMLTLPVWSQQGAKKRPARAKPAPVPAQKLEPPVVFPIESIRVEGSRLYSDERLVQATGLKKGQPGDQETFEAAKERLIQSAAFGSVGYRYEPSADGRGYAVTFEVADVEQVYPYRLERIEVEESALRAYLQTTFPLFDSRIPGSRTVLDRYRKAIEEFLGDRKPVEGIGARLTGDRPEELYILFHPAGAPPVVAEVDFKGNDVIPTTTLQNAIHGVAVGAEYREGRFRELLAGSIVPLYEARGRIRVAFPKIESAAVSAVKGLKITVQVEEGPAFSLGTVRVDGTQTMNDELVRVANLKQDDLANFDEVRQGQNRIHALLRANGYMKAASTIERVHDDMKKTVDIVFQVTPGPQFSFGRLFIKGLNIHGEHEVRRIWGMKPGQAFNADYPNYFLNRLREDNIFENLGEKTRAVVNADEKTLKVDVTLEFAGEPPMKKQRP
jgi:outer membrane protein insertion porin family